jgi:hypothetical protein
LVLVFHSDVCHPLSVPGNSGRRSRKILKQARINRLRARLRRGGRRITRMLCRKLCLRNPPTTRTRNSLYPKAFTSLACLVGKNTHQLTRLSVQRRGQRGALSLPSTLLLRSGGIWIFGFRSLIFYRYQLSATCHAVALAKTDHYPLSAPLRAALSGSSSLS